MKSNSYMDRALKAHDPRYARILGKLGYERSDMTPAEGSPEPDELEAARAEFTRVTGRKPSQKWGIETLRKRTVAPKAKG